MACATFELAELVATQFVQRNTESNGFVRIDDGDTFSAIARQLIDAGVTHMSWNAMRRSTSIHIVGLEDFANCDD